MSLAEGAQKRPKCVCGTSQFCVSVLSKIKTMYTGLLYVCLCAVFAFFIPRRHLVAGSITCYLGAWRFSAEMSVFEFHITCVAVLGLFWMRNKMKQ